MNKIIGLAKSIPDWMELAIVMILCFGTSVVGSVVSFVSGEAFGRIEFTNALAVESIVYEVIIFALVIAFLYSRGYRLWERIQFTPSIKGTLIALGLFVSTYMVYALLFNLVYVLVGEDHFPIAAYSMTIGLPLTLVVSLLNPLFEETFIVGYLFDKLRRNNVVIIILVSTVIRTSYHLYQGWIGILSIVPIGLFFGVVYWKTKNLWPLYTSHVLMDFVGLLGSAE